MISRTPGPAGCATEISPLKYISVAHGLGAHHGACATEMCGLGVTLAHSVAHHASCATEIGAPQKFCAMRHRYLKLKYWYFLFGLYKYRYKGKFDR